MDASLGRSLLSFLAAVPDPRSRHGRRHPLSAILALVCCAIMCGAKSYAAIAQWGQDQDIALMHRLGFTRKPPKTGGIRKVLIALDQGLRGRADPVGRILTGPPIALAPLEAFALDGKTARGSFDGLEKAVHLLSLVATNRGSRWLRRRSPTAARTRPTSTRQLSGCSGGRPRRAPDHRRRHVLPARSVPADHRCPRPLPLVRQR